MPWRVLRPAEPDAHVDEHERDARDYRQATVADELEVRLRIRDEEKDRPRPADDGSDLAG